MRLGKLLPPIALLLALPLAAAAADPDPVGVFAYTLKHQPAMEALRAIQPLLTSRGTVELRPGDNTLIVRDTRSALGRIAPALRSFDHPARRLRIDVMIVEARRAPFSPPVPKEQLPDALAMRLRGFLPYNGYRLLARTSLDVLEGDDVTYEMGEGFSVSFHPATVVDAQVRLHDFQISRASTDAANPGNRRLFRSSLTLPLDRPMALALASAEDSANALMLVLTPRLLGEPPRLVPRPRGGDGQRPEGR
jgi:Bacterial type II/III secretion system short domain